MATTTKKKKEEEQTKVVNNRGTNNSSVISAPKSSPLDMTKDQFDSKVAVKKANYETQRAKRESSDLATRNQANAQYNMQGMADSDLSALSSARRQRNTYNQNLDIAEAAGIQDADMSIFDTAKKKYNLTDDELDKIINEYDYQMTQKGGEQTHNKYVQYAKEHPGLASAGSVAAKLGGSVLGVPELLMSASDTAKGKRLSQYEGARELLDMSNALREGASSDMSGVGSTVYNTGMGVADMITESALAKGMGISPAMLMAANTANEGVSSALDRGISNGKALGYGAATGVVDYGLTKFGLDKILGGREGLTLLKQMGKGATIEALENAVQRLSETGLDRAINKDNSYWDMAYNSVYDNAYANKYNEQIQKGATEEIADRKAKISANQEAKAYANEQMWKEVGQSAAMGGLFGAAFSGMNYKPNNGMNPLGLEVNNSNLGEGVKADISATEDIPELSFPKGYGEGEVRNDIEGSYRTLPVIEKSTNDSNQANAMLNLIDENNQAFDKTSYKKDIKDMSGDEFMSYLRNRYLETAPTEGPEVDINNVIYHSGDLSKLNKAETNGRFYVSNRGTGYYGTGHYFTDSARRPEIETGAYAGKPMSSVDISGYDNLYRADTDAKASGLHSFLTNLTRKTQGDGRYSSEELYEQFRNAFPDKQMSKADFDNKVSSLTDYMRGSSLDDRGDSVSTIFMKDMGYGGVDTRGTRFADTEFGIVIYDLDEDSVLQSNVTDPEIRKGAMNRKVRTPGKSVWNEEVDKSLQGKIDSRNLERRVNDEFNSSYDRTKLDDLENRINQTKEKISNQEEADAYYKKILEDDEYYQREARKTAKEFENMGMPLTDEELDDFVRGSARRYFSNVDEFGEPTERVSVDSLKEELKTLEDEYNAEENNAFSVKNSIRDRIKREQSVPELTDEELLNEFGYTSYEPNLEDPRKTTISKNDAKSLNKQLDSDLEVNGKIIADKNAELDKIDREYKKAREKANSDNKRTRNNARAKMRELSAKYTELSDETDALAEDMSSRYTSLPMLKDTESLAQEYASKSNKPKEKTKSSNVKPDITKAQLETLLNGNNGELPQIKSTPKANVESNVPSMENATTTTAKPTKRVTQKVGNNAERLAEVGNGETTSQYYDNTAKGGLYEEEHQKLFGDRDNTQLKYKELSNEQSMKDATQFINDRGVEKARDTLLDKNRVYTAQDVDANGQLIETYTKMARDMEANGEDASELWKNVSQLSRRRQIEASANGQMLQALKKWAKSSPQGLLDYSIAQLMKAQDGKVKGKTANITKVADQIQDVINKGGSKEEVMKNVKGILDMNLQLFAQGKSKVKIDGADELLKYIEDNYKDAKGRYVSPDARVLSDIGRKAVNIIEKANGISSLDDVQTKQMYDLFEEALKHEKGSREYQEPIAEAMKILDSSIPSSVGKMIKTTLYDNMLMSLKTMVTRNLGGNIGVNAIESVAKIPKVLTDVGVSAITGNRTQDIVPSAYVEGAKGFGKGLSDIWLDVTHKDADGKWSPTKTIRSGQGENVENIFAGVERTFKTQSENKAIKNVMDYLNAVDKSVRTGMEVGDRPVYEAAYAANKAEMEHIVNEYGEAGLRKGYPNGDKLEIEEIIKGRAVKAGLEAVSQNNSKTKEGMTSLKKFLSSVSEDLFGADVMGISTTPFVEVPGNMLSRFFQYSPLGVVGNTARTIGEVAKGDFDQRRFTTEAGRNITGGLALWGATELAKNGLISDAYSDDPDEKKAQQNNGYLEYAVKNPINGLYYDISDIPVVGPMARQGRIIANAQNDALEKGESQTAATVGALPKAMGEATADTLFQGLNRLTGTNNSFSSSGNIGENVMGNLASFGASASTPQIVRQIAQYGDDYKRDLGDYQTLDYYKNQWKNGIPGLRQTLNPKLDTSGEYVLEDQGRKGAEKFLDTFIAPYKKSDYDSVNPYMNQVADELNELTNGEKNPQLPKLTKGDLTGTKGYDKDLYSHEDLYNAQSEYYSRNSELGQKFIQTDFYNSLDPTEKAEMLDKLYSASKGLMKENLVRNGKTPEAIAREEENETLYTSDDKVTAKLREGDVDGAFDQMQKSYLFKKYDISTSSKEANAMYEEGPEAFEQWANQYNAENDMLESYGVERNESFSTLIPSLDSMNLSPTDSGKALYTARNGKISQKASQVLDDVGYDGLWYYQKAMNIKNTKTKGDNGKEYSNADLDKNGKVTEKERQALFESLGLAPDVAAYYAKVGF